MLKSFTIQQLWHSETGGKPGRISLLLVWLCTGLFLVLRVLDWVHLLEWENAIALLGISRAGLFGGHLFYQLVTAPLTHGGVVHLAFNMLALLMLGPALEKRLGRSGFAIFFSVCSLASLAGFLVFSSSPWSVGCGASGGIFGLLVAQAVYYPDSRVVVFGFFPLKMRVAAFVMAVIEFMLMMDGGRQASGSAGHLFGALAALPCLYLLRRRSVPRKDTGIRKLLPQKERRAKVRIPGEIPKEL